MIQYRYFLLTILQQMVVIKIQNKTNNNDKAIIIIKNEVEAMAII